MRHVILKNDIGAAKAPHPLHRILSRDALEG